MSDNWDFFFTTVEEAPASISVDLGLSQTAPDPERPSLGWIWIYMEHPREDGMPSQPESERLSSIEVHLCARLEERVDAVYVGRATTRGRRELYFYVADDAPFLEVAKEALADGPVVRAEQGLRDDAEWTFYFESLFPTAEELELIQNRRTVFALQERGDQLDQPHDVHHWFSFDARKDRAAFVKQLPEGRYRVAASPDVKDDERTRYRVHLVGRHAVDWETVNDVVLGLLDAAHKSRGVYDGWETEPVAPAP